MHRQCVSMCVFCPHQLSPLYPAMSHTVFRSPGPLLGLCTLLHEFCLLSIPTSSDYSPYFTYYSMNFTYTMKGRPRVYCSFITHSYLISHAFTPRWPHVQASLATRLCLVCHAFTPFSHAFTVRLSCVLVLAQMHVKRGMNACET